MKRWVLPENANSSLCNENARELARACGASELCCKILLARGIRTPQEALSFLGGGETLHDPFLLRDMEQAVAAIEQAMQDGRLIVIYGDYDCDGITSTVLLYRYFEEQGARVAYYIPDREDEGYGLNRGACDTLKASGAGLIVTVDNGVTAFDEIDYLHSLGIPVVVTDHHQPRGALPKAQAVVNPHRADDDYPFADLSGVGVAFKLVCALEGDTEGLDTLERYADLIGIGTIADVVPLTGENRTIVRAGLKKLEESDNCGLRALLTAAGLNGGGLRAESVSFGLAPRLNAASRMGQCDKSVELMLCDDDQAAAQIAREIDGYNHARKALEDQIKEDIAAQLAADPSLARDRVIVLAGEGWHRGVIGIVASRVMERYGRPCLLISTQGDDARGSARSVPGFSIIDAVCACAPLLTKFGGHTLAAGFSLRSQNIGAFRRALNEEAARTHPDMPVPPLKLTAVLSPDEVDLRAAASLDALEPFGTQNESPVLLIPNARIEEVCAIGEGKHLRVKFTFGGRLQSAVYFRMTPERFLLGPGETGDLAVSLSVSEFKGTPRLSIRIQDARPCGFAEEDYFADQLVCERLMRGEPVAPEEALRLMPSRDQMALLYRAVRARGEVEADPDVLTLRVGRGALTYAQMRIAAQALIEARLVSQTQGRLRLLPAQGKVRLEETAILSSLLTAQVPGNS